MREVFVQDRFIQHAFSHSASRRSSPSRLALFHLGLPCVRSRPFRRRMTLRYRIKCNKPKTDQHEEGHHWRGRGLPYFKAGNKASPCLFLYFLPRLRWHRNPLLVNCWPYDNQDQGPCTLAALHDWPPSLVTTGRKQCVRRHINTRRRHRRRATTCPCHRMWA